MTCHSGDGARSRTPDRGSESQGWNVHLSEFGSRGLTPAPRNDSPNEGFDGGSFPQSRWMRCTSVCVLIAGTALVLISAVIPWAVYTRYVLNSAASWPEPTAVLFTIVLTFIGAAACYRRNFT